MQRSRLSKNFKLALVPGIIEETGVFFKASANKKKFQKEQVNKTLDDGKIPVLPYTTHIWHEYLDLVEQIRKAERGKDVYAQRNETIERSLRMQRKNTNMEVFRYVKKEPQP